MPLPVDDIAAIAHAAIRAHAHVCHEDCPEWTAAPQDYRDKLIETVCWVIGHPDAGPSATWDFMRDGEGIDFDMAKTEMQYRLFLLRAVVLSQVNWDEDQQRRQAVA